jgi:predicted MPP superfamily phosphohydrolase
VNAKGYFKRPHFSVLPDCAIHPAELTEAREARARTAKSSRKTADPAPAATSGNGAPANTGTTQSEAIEAKLAMLRTQEVKQRLAGYLDQLSKPLITSVVTGLSELYASGRMAGNLVNDVFFNLDRAVDLIDQINTMEPMLPSDNTLPSILHSHSAKSLSDLQTFGDLKAVSRKVTTIYQAEQERQHGTTAA